MVSLKFITFVADMSTNKVNFSSKIGLIAATVGSAVGLGNIWRFPGEAANGGGAAFLVVYIACVFLLGVPVMVSEFALGRGGKSDAVGVFRNLTPGKKWWITGMFAVIASYMVLCFYMVVAGWTLEYLWQSITGNLYAPDPGVTIESIDGYKAQFAERMHQYIQEDWDPLVNTYVMIGINLMVLMAGVQKGIERLSNLLMPLLFVILLIFCVVALSLPEAGAGLSYFFHPDFSKLTAKVVIGALGQAFFSLSLGMGILVTYSSYFPKDTRLARTAVTVSVLDLLVAVMMGIIIFPAIMSFGLQGEAIQGTTLVFVTLPEVFAHMPLTQLWSSLFFMLLLVAALTSTISIAEVTIAFFQDRLNMRRLTACLIVLMPLFIFSTLCSLSLGTLDGVRIFGKTIFDFFDTFATNILLPIVAMTTCIYLGWFAPKDFLQEQITNQGTVRSWILRPVRFIIRWVAPVLIFIILISPLLFS